MKISLSLVLSLSFVDSVASRIFKFKNKDGNAIAFPPTPSPNIHYGPNREVRLAARGVY
jgi:hypothetical protein